MDKKEIENATRSFRRHLEYERNLSANTVRAYMTDIGQFSDFLLKNGLSLNTTGVRDINRYIGTRFSVNSKTSTARKLAALRTFFRFLNVEKITANNPAKIASVPRMSKHLPSFLSVDEIDALLRIIGSKDNRFFIRDSAMFELAYSCGLRVSELVSVTLDDIDFEQSEVRVFGKGAKQRVIPLGSKAAAAIMEYMSVRLEFKPKTDRVFIGSKGTGITSRSVARILKHHALKAGINKNVSPHTLRHSFATHLLASGSVKEGKKDRLRAIQLMLGHSSLSSTQKYTHISVEQLMSIYDTTHPRA